MLYMVIETFDAGADAVYARFHEKGRMLPDGVTYVDSWVSEDMRRCFQVMSSPERALIDQWVSNWDDIVSFEIVPVLTSMDAQAQVSGAEQVSTTERS